MDRGSIPSSPLVRFTEIINYKINNQITAPELRVIGDDGANLNIMPREAALKLAKEKGLDLIEIAPAAKPPVARIISYDKFRYQKEKELRKQRSGQKISGMKQVQISVRAAKNDLEIKAKRVQEFLEDGNKVEIMLTLRGREKYNREWTRLKMDEFLKMIPTNYKIILPQKFIGKGIIVQIDKT